MLWNLEGNALHKDWIPCAERQVFKTMRFQEVRQDLEQMLDLKKEMPCSQCGQLLSEPEYSCQKCGIELVFFVKTV